MKFFLMQLTVVIDAGILIVALVVLLVDGMLGIWVGDLFEFELCELFCCEGRKYGGLLYQESW